MRAAPVRRFSGGPPISRLTLPVSGVDVALFQPTGAEDLLLAEGRAADPSLTATLLARLAWSEAATDWSEFSVADVDTLLVRLRQAMLGDRVVADVRCAGAACGRRVDISFGLGAYLAHHLPKPARARGRGWVAAPAADAPGWYALQGEAAGEARFRLPTLGDQIAVQGRADAASALAARCIRPEGASPRTRSRAETAMRALAPALAGPIKGRCPECSATITAHFEARHYCLKELGERSRFVYDDIDALAERYHWSERSILGLPNDRRSRYAERARQANLQ